MRKRIAILSVLLSMIVLCGCTPIDQLLDAVAPEPDDSVPGRMVSSITVIAHPEEPDLERSYHELETVSGVLRQLRDLDTAQSPEDEPHLTEDREYVYITATYADSDIETYCILDEQYLRDRDGAWCILEEGKAAAFFQFLTDTPSN